MRANRPGRWQSSPVVTQFRHCPVGPAALAWPRQRTGGGRRMDPIAAIVVTLSLLLLFILALILGSRALRKRRRARREAYAAAATARGWTYEERGAGLTNMFTGKPF